jgi:hypothetical protein
MIAKRKEVDERYPSIEKKELISLYSRIKPVVRGSQISDEKLDAFTNRWAIENKLGVEESIKLRGNANNELFWIKNVNPFNIAFAWSAEPIGVATGLKEIKTIKTYHSYAYYGFFKPTIEEVIAQIPVELRGKVAAFEVVPPNGVADCLTPDDKYHKAHTVLYGMGWLATKKLLRGEGEGWSQKREGAQDATLLKKQKAEAEEAKKMIMKALLSATENDVQITSYASFRVDITTLLEIENKSEANEVKRALYEIIKGVRGSFSEHKISAFKAGLVLKELAGAVEVHDPGFLSQEQFNGIFNSSKESWGYEASELARELVIEACKELREERIKYYSAQDLLWSARPFIDPNPRDQLFLAEAMKYVYEVTAMKDIHWRKNEPLEELRRVT